MSLTPKNWSSFQHYKDRSPAWIKLHRGLLDNMEYHRLSPKAAKALPLIWLLASEYDGILPEAAQIAFRLRLSESEIAEILTDLIERDFLIDGDDLFTSEPAERGATPAQRRAKSHGFGSRHISDETKRVIWLRDEGKCCECGSSENIEYDHKVPVSKGGNSEESNIQLLCRACNRKKRVRIATQGLSSRSPERENKKQEREEKEGEESSSGAQARRRAERLPADWKPSQEDFEFAHSKGMAHRDIATEAEKFKNYWTAKSGKDATKLDWPATWRNWILTAIERRGTGNGHRKPNLAGRAFELADQLRERELAEGPDRTHDTFGSG